MGTVDTLLAEHANFRVTCVDRVGVAGDVRALQFEGGVVKFILQRGFPIPSPVVLARNHDRLVSEIDRFVTNSGLAAATGRFRGSAAQREAPTIAFLGDMRLARYVACNSW